jgi:hypothetical protein
MNKIIIKHIDSAIGFPEDLKKLLAQSISEDIEKLFLDWWKNQANEYSKLLLIKENEIQFLRKKNK